MLLFLFFLLFVLFYFVTSTSPMRSHLSSCAVLVSLVPPAGFLTSDDHINIAVNRLYQCFRNSWLAANSGSKNGIGPQ